jgi:hypothetical protein
LLKNCVWRVSVPLQLSRRQPPRKTTTIFLSHPRVSHALRDVRTPSMTLQK